MKKKYFVNPKIVEFSTLYARVGKYGSPPTSVYVTPMPTLPHGAAFCPKQFHNWLKLISASDVTC